MAIAKVGTDTNGTSASLSYSFSHTLVAGTNRLIVVSAAAENLDTLATSSITYGGVTMTQAVGYLSGTSGARNLVTIRYLLESELPANGSNTVTVTFSGTANALGSVAYCAEYSGVFQGVPEATNAAYETVSQTVTNTISPTTGAWVISAMGCGSVDSSWTQNQSQVELLDSQGTGGSHTVAFAELRSANGETSLSSTYSGTVLREVRCAASFATDGALPDQSSVIIYQINAGGSAASPYIADQFFSGGTAATVGTAITIPGALFLPAPQAVYQAERYGAMTYTITGLTAYRRYIIRLHFAELYWTAANQRLFDVSINGTLVLDNYDIYVEAGNANFTAQIEWLFGEATASGEVVIQFANVTDNASIQGIEIWTVPTNIWVNVAGTWKEVTDVYYNNSGSWSYVSIASTNIAGTWKQVTT